MAQPPRQRTRERCGVGVRESREGTAFSPLEVLLPSSLEAIAD